MKKINSLKELTEKKRRIVQRIDDLEMLIEKDIATLKKDLNVWHVASNKVKQFLVTEENGMMGESIGIVVDAVVKKIFLRKSNWVMKFILSFLLKNFAKNYFAKNAEHIFERIKSIVNNHHSEEAAAN